MTVEERIEKKIRKSFEPEYMDIKNQSHLHAGHQGHDGSGQSHFRLVVVAQRFEGKSRLERQRMIYKILEEEFQDSLHALSIAAYAPGEENTS
jgi:BolA family transcriptional regulator, general stress-responsive regulator